MPEAKGSYTVEQSMAYEWMRDSDPGARNLASLERAYRRDLQDIAAARACCPSLRQVTDRDEQEILGALAHIGRLRNGNIGRSVEDLPMRR